MATLPTTHRPTSLIAAAAVATAIAAGALAWSLSQPSDQPAAPAVHSQSQPSTPAHHFEPTTSGGRVILGE